MAIYSERRMQFRRILSGERCVYPASVFDPLSARIAREIGFEIGMFAGSTASQTVLGAPDYILLTLTEFADQARRITRASDLPLMVDADHGYGNALNAARTVVELEAAGVCGLSIEDTYLPEAFGSGGKATITSRSEGLAKVKAAVAAKTDETLVVAGRTSAPLITDMDDCIARVTSYEAAGADAVFVVGIKDRDQLDMLSAAVKCPIILGSAPGNLQDVDYLSERGVRICLQGHHTIPAAARAIFDTLSALRNGTKPAELQTQPKDDLMDRIMRKAAYDADRTAYLNPSDE
jgi:carboxyvinyl-carboxyphosphonate phosphorylmutase